MKTVHSFTPSGRRAERGISLIIVMLLLVIVSILGAGAAQISLLGERSSRNDRDSQIAWQAAEAALADAALDLRTGLRSATFGVNTASNPNLTNEVNANSFIAGCGTSLSAPGSSLGLCATQSDGTANPIWLTVDFTNTSTPQTVKFGTFTGRNFETGTVGAQPRLPPRYIIELVRDTGASRDLAESNPPYAFRVTAMGFGPRPDIQAVMQMVYRN